MYYVYVCYVSAIGKRCDRVDDNARKVADHLNALGLRCHELGPASTRMEALAVELNSELEGGGYRPTAKRYWRIRAARLVIQRRRLSGRHLVTLMRHLTDFSLLKRGVLNVINACYKCLHPEGHTAAPAWP